ncbi:aminoglycoside phosphotransferase family protein [Clavibacter sp. VKM Ac-2542]|uniref:aminoglycoside phosphotransferase family protein n=1 Tax=Clavibacter sp. VKM Ac-2542 TaxID=2783811 RepID=UPI00188A2FA5|nr:aminoglycoside phosphotransferase family protein [Clavibacter sp. VKM Ac-2542]MBF4622284.1 aminoglycoside phosphotransferase family protein [Clavibacter sp. VKM Ac-2542]
MSDAHDLGPRPKRINVDAEQVRRLVADQLPRWADLPVVPVADGGWDNRTFRLGDALLVRLPSAAEYALAVAKEQRWLPVLAPALPVPIPVPRGQGVPGSGYPFPWSVYEWIDGVPANAHPARDPVEFAEDLAGFVAALQGVDASGGPLPGTHNWFRGGSLRTYDAQTRRALAELDGEVDSAAALRIWSRALESRWDGRDVWFHGDLAAGNVLLDDGRLSAVIDFGTCGVGDPACDMAAAWTLLPAEGRAAFRDRLEVDDGLWSRGRGWALWKTLITCAAHRDETDRATVDARRALEEICS